MSCSVLQITACVILHVVWCHHRCSEWCLWPFTGMKTLIYITCSRQQLSLYWLSCVFSIVTALESGEDLHRMLQSAGFLHTAAVNYRDLKKLFLNSYEHVDVSQHQVTPFILCVCAQMVCARPCTDNVCVCVSFRFCWRLDRFCWTSSLWVQLTAWHLAREDRYGHKSCFCVVKLQHHSSSINNSSFIKDFTHMHISFWDFSF